MATSIEELKKAKQTWEFEAPPFANGVSLVVELRQPSLTTMIFDGTITNPLINDVQKITDIKAKGKKPTTEQQAAVYKFINSVIDYCIVSPTTKEINEFAGGLTDNQKLAIYGEVMKSVTDLSSFRTDTANS